MAGNTVKLTTCSIENFGSYQSLNFDYSNLGLSLVFGPTGSGKSTLPDVASWLLYGVTSKGYKADEVRNWSNLDKITKGTITVLTPTGSIEITRVRGKPADNDLYWKESDKEDVTRGKDLTDTQRLLNARLGLDPDLFISGSYYHEFCPTGSFFLAPTSAKRELFEKVVDLNLPLNLLAKAKEQQKQTLNAVSQLSNNNKLVSSHIELILKNVKDLHELNDAWHYDKDENIKLLESKAVNYDTEQKSNIKELTEKHSNFETYKTDKVTEYTKKCSALKLYDTSAINKEIMKLNTNIKLLKSEKCTECGGPKHSENLYREMDLLKDLQAEVSNQKVLKNDLMHYEQVIKSTQDQVNPYKDLLEQAQKEENPYFFQLNELKQSSSPFDAQLQGLYQNFTIKTAESCKIEEELEAQQKKSRALDTIASLSYDLRGLMLNLTVQQIQQSTNHYLETYFDAEIRVGFALEDADKLTVTINKNGHDCAFKQLSKGQRALLRLAFTVSIMTTVSHNHGVHFDNLFFDEALDGLDGELKSKAFRLFEELSKEHSSILVIDHSEEFKTLFNKQYSVTIESDISTIREVYE